MKQIIKDVLDDISNSQINLASEAARNMVSGLISAALKTKGSYKEYTKYELDEQEARKDWVCSICGKSTFDVGVDYIGSGTNHLGCELEIEMGNKNDDSDIPEGIKRAKELSQQALDEGARSLQKQLYTEMTSDGLPEGGDTQAVLESHKLADEIVDNQKGKWIYESPDGGKTVFRRPFSDYDPKNKEEIDWETKEPTGRKFTEYNNGNWRSKDEG
jgi:hypothetical protein